MNCLKYHIKNEREKELLAWQKRRDKMTPEEKEQEQRDAEEVMRKWATLMSIVPMVHTYLCGRWQK